MERYPNVGSPSSIYVRAVHCFLSDFQERTARLDGKLSFFEFIFDSSLGEICVSHATLSYMKISLMVKLKANGNVGQVCRTLLETTKNAESPKLIGVIKFPVQSRRWSQKLRGGRWPLKCSDSLTTVGN